MPIHRNILEPIPTTLAGTDEEDQWLVKVAPFFSHLNVLQDETWRRGLFFSTTKLDERDAFRSMKGRRFERHSRCYASGIHPLFNSLDEMPEAAKAASSMTINETINNHQ